MDENLNLIKPIFRNTGDIVSVSKFFDKIYFNFLQIKYFQ